MDKNNVPKIITFLFIILTLLTGMYDYLFRSGEKFPRVILLIVVICGCYLLFAKTFLHKSRIAYYIALVFIFISIYLANLWDFYGLPSYDKFLHLVSGILLAFYGLIIYCNLCGKDIKDLSKNKMIFVFPFIFCLAAAGGWEIWEFTTDSLFNLNAQNNSLLDTMTDIICGTVGGILSCVLLYTHYRIRKIKLISAIIKENT